MSLPYQSKKKPAAEKKSGNRRLEAFNRLPSRRRKYLEEQIRKKEKEISEFRNYLESAETSEEVTKDTPSMLELSVVHGLLHYENYEKEISQKNGPQKSFLTKYKGKTKSELAEIYSLLEKAISNL